MIYNTDGSFEGILTAVFEAYEKKEEPEAILIKDCCQMPLGIEIREIETDLQKSNRVWKGIVQKISHEVLEMLYRVFLSNHPEAGFYIYRYIRIGLTLGPKVINYLQHPDVLIVRDLSRKVYGEMHLFLGILRFKKLKNGIFYAQYEPDHNITILLTDHFASRLSDQPWIIHDIKRKCFAVYNTREVVLSHGELPFSVDGESEEFEILWKKYFKTIAIESRRNPKLQRSFMPGRYWNHLVEKQL